MGVVVRAPKEETTPFAIVVAPADREL